MAIEDDGRRAWTDPTWRRLPRQLASPQPLPRWSPQQFHRPPGLLTVGERDGGIVDVARPAKCWWPDAGASRPPDERPDPLCRIRQRRPLAVDERRCDVDATAPHVQPLHR